MLFLSVQIESLFFVVDTHFSSSQFQVFIAETGFKLRFKTLNQQIHFLEMTETMRQTRQQYQPATVQILFVAEAVQPGKVFFYHKNSNVFRAIKEAFSQVFGEFENSDEFLEFLKENGCYVDYLCPDMINGLMPEVRLKARLDGIKPLSECLVLLQPKVIITVMKVLENFVLEAVKLSAITSVGYTKAIAFPAHSRTNADKCCKN